MSQYPASIPKGLVLKDVSISIGRGRSRVVLQI